jgi:hypothetical protein
MISQDVLLYSSMYGRSIVISKKALEDEGRNMEAHVFLQACPSLWSPELPRTVSQPLPPNHFAGNLVRVRSTKELRLTMWASNRIGKACLAAVTKTTSD